MKFLYIIVLIPLVGGDSIVLTNSGPIRGKSVAGKNVEAFLGIPYAEPPVGQLRFAKPIPKSPWEEIYEAKELPVSCIQKKSISRYKPNPDSKFSEDCLYLNLWVPENKSDKKIIIVYIHGGGLEVGSTNVKIINGAMLSEQSDVIVATMNFRMGSLGFFSGFIDEAPGNLGFYDQLMAIQWIKDNAKHFLGDPESITLMGECSGSLSVSLHMVSPLSKHLFKRVILLSAIAFHPIFSDDNKALFAASHTIATAMGCAEDEESLKKNPKGVIECLKSVPAENFLESDLAVRRKFFRFLPRTGDDFLPGNPSDLLKESNFTDKEVLLGITRNEGSSYLLMNTAPNILGTHGEKADSVHFNETSTTGIMEDIVNWMHLEKENGTDKVLRSYLDRVETEEEYTFLNALTEFTGDFIIVCPTVFQADYQSLNNASVYFYLFDYRPPSSIFAKWMGVVHFDEVQYIFGNGRYANFSESEREFSKDVMNKLTTFARTGNPNVRGEIKWPQYTFENPNYFVIGKKRSIGIRPDNYRCEAWRKIFRAEINN